MNVTEKYESLTDYAVARFGGVVNLDGAVQLVSAPIARARAENSRRLLVNVTGLDGVPSPTLADRYFFVRQWTKVA